MKTIYANSTNMGLKYLALVLLILVFCNSSLYAKYYNNYKPVRGLAKSTDKKSTIRIDFNKAADKLEKRADKQFIKGNFDRAFTQYEKAIEKATSNHSQKVEISRKVARLYTYCQQYTNASTHYGYVYENRPKDLSVTDVCNYIDMLRANEKDHQAEVVCRFYAFDEVYNVSQRYMNTLQAISKNRHYYSVGEQEYTLSKFDFNTDKSEYFIDHYNGKPYYIASNSHMKDPEKVYYHQNRYYYCADSLNTGMVFPFIPRDFQEGPIAINDSNNVIVVTANKYNGMDQISLKEETIGLYSTKLYASYFNKKKNRWTKFIPLFSEEDDFSYAHPVFINGDKSILFCSNRPGGFGGMDIYISHRNENNEWSKPANLGKHINTEANEIFPNVNGEYISFSSNGHVGNGGYDIYEIGFSNNSVLDGSLYHYPYPINTYYNDFGLKYQGEHVYMVSDRGRDNYDDVYRVYKKETAINSADIKSTTLEQKYALNGLGSVIKGFNKYQKKSNQFVDGESELYARYREGELLLTLYYDFDSATLTQQHIDQIKSVLENTSLKDISEVLVVGFSDKLGSKAYNKNLSFERADKVVKYLQSQCDFDRISAEGRGRLFLDEEDMIKNNKLYFIYDNELLNMERQAFNAEVEKYKEARKVDVIIKKIKN